MSHAYYSLYCKQQELQQPWEAPWACGFASLVTCFRILGDRTTENQELIERFRAFGAKPHDGMTTDEAIALARAFGYRTVRNPNSTKHSKDDFLRWMRKQWSGNRPILVSVDSGKQQGEADHWWTVFGDTEQSNVWVMDPLNDEIPFQCRAVSEIIDFVSCNDGEGYIEYDGVAVFSVLDSDLTGIPPSAELMDFLNANRRYTTGWTSQAIAAALVDNHFSSINGVDSQGRARGGRTIAVASLLEETEPVIGVIHDWDVFFSEQQRANMDALRAVLHDIEAHLEHRIAASEADHITREIVLNVILIGTNLME